MLQTIINKINPDLENERKKCKFNVEEFAEWWNDGKEKLQQKREKDKFFFNDPELANLQPLSYSSHAEIYEESVKRAAIIIRKIQQFQKTDNIKPQELTWEILYEFRGMLGSIISSKIAPEHMPFNLNFGMFIPSILGQGTEEQKEKWLQKAWKCQILGTYAQTELGHGTFIRGLETRADYDPKTEEFSLNSPKLTSYKWWPGGLGHTANYAIVLAQLYSQGSCHGLHQFIVQVRDLETHKPLHGVIIGEIGSKIGMNAMNNGYLGLENVRIPRMNMLMKNTKISKEGIVKKHNSSTLTYGTMIFVRVVILRDMVNNLAKASTIATRYSAVRRQSPINPNEPEPVIMDHRTQQLKLFPNLAMTVIFKITANCIWNIYNDVMAEINIGNLKRLPELHSLVCCLKAVCSYDATSAVEKLRLSCGGHGYMNCSNFPNIYAFTTAAITYEGENTVLLLQTARFLTKSWIQAYRRQRVPSTVTYLMQGLSGRVFQKWDGSVLCIIRAFHYVAANKVRIAIEHLEKRSKQAISPGQAFNLTGIELVQAADFHCRAFILATAYVEIKGLTTKVSTQMADTLENLMELYAIDSCLNRLGDLLRFIKISEKNISILQSRLEDLLDLVRPNAVGIVDGFDLHDDILNSALGAYDGNVYERLFNEAKKSPLNQEEVNKSFHLYLKPFMKSNL